VPRAKAEVAVTGDELPCVMRRTASSITVSVVAVLTYIVRHFESSHFSSRNTSAFKELLPESRAPNLDD
jgi:hypothetical protein